MYLFSQAAVIAQMPAGTDTVFIQVPAGKYQVGKKGHRLNPLRTVQVNAYAIAATEVTNEQFARFVAATGYITDAERLHNALVFEPGLPEFRWKEDSTACWRYPNGVSRGDLTGKLQHPVTSISFTDVQAYCRWAGVRLPALDEWEIAARAGSTTDYFWGWEMGRIGEFANVWHGHDHLKADSSDEYMYTSPIGSYRSNPWGIYDIYGNVFEFCDGHLGVETIAHARGGSWWCSAHSCSYFNSLDIGRVHIHASFSNQGFRVVKNL